MRVSWWWSSGHVSHGSVAHGSISLTVLAGEKGLATQHLCEDTSHRPHINGLGVLLESQHNFGRTVPTRGNIFCHEARVVLLRRSRTSQTKVADFQIAVSVEEQVRGLEIAVEHVGRVHGLESAQGLVDEVLAVVVGEVLGADDTVHVRLHELLVAVSHE